MIFIKYIDWMLDVPALRTFLAVVDQGGFNAAAALTGRPQPTISMQIKRLEQTVGAPILLRDRSGVRPTREGETLIGYARRMVDLHDSALSAFSPRETRTHLRIGTPADYATTFLVDVMPTFARMHPDVDLDVQCDLSHVLMNRMAAGDVDVAIVTRDRQTGTRGELLTREPVVWSTARAGSAHRRDPIPLAAFPVGCLFRDFAAEAAEALPRATRLAFTSPALSALQIAVIGDIAVAILARSTVTADMRILEPSEGFPPLPDVEIEMVVAPAARAKAAPFLEAVVAATRSRGR